MRLDRGTNDGSDRSYIARKSQEGPRMRIIELSIVPRIAFCVMMIAGLICGPTSISAQVRDSYTHTEDSGNGGKKITTETQFENGDVTIETRYVDAKGKPQRQISKTKKSDGESVYEYVTYDSKGQIAERVHERSEVNGQVTYRSFEQYKDGELRAGDSFYYDAAGNIQSHRIYNPATQTYEEAEPRPREVSPTKAPADTKSRPAAETKASIDAGDSQQNGQSEASKKFRENVPYGQQQPPMMVPPYGYGMGGYGTRTDGAQKQDETPPVIIPPYGYGTGGYGTGGYDAPHPPWPGGPAPWPPPPPP